MGFWLGCVEVGGIVCSKFERKEQHDKEQIKTTITSSAKNNTPNAIPSRRFVSQFIDKIGYLFLDYKKRVNLLIPRFLKFLPLCNLQLQLPRRPIKSAENDSLVTSFWTLSHQMFVRDKTPLVYTKR